MFDKGNSIPDLRTSSKKSNTNTKSKEQNCGFYLSFKKNYMMLMTTTIIMMVMMMVSKLTMEKYFKPVLPPSLLRMS